jgi:hypothetical protein
MPDQEYEQNPVLGWMKSDSGPWQHNFQLQVGAYFKRRHQLGLMRAIFVDHQYDDDALTKCYHLALEAQDDSAQSLISLMQAMTMAQRQLVLHPKDETSGADIEAPYRLWCTTFEAFDMMITGKNVIKALETAVKKSPDREPVVIAPEVGYDMMLDWIRSNHRFWHSNFAWWIAYYFQRHHNYGPLRDIFEDLKYDDDTLANCCGLAMENGDREAKDIVRLMQAMTPRQRQQTLHTHPFGQDLETHSSAWSSFFKAIEQMAVGEYVTKEVDAAERRQRSQA